MCKDTLFQDILFVHGYAKESWKVKMALGIGSAANCMRNISQAQFSISIYISLYF
jgi:hypothetical protein